MESLPQSRQADGGLRFLVVEDNRANQYLASMLLAKMGHTAEIAANGQLALERLAQGKFDAVLMDCQMPVLDGYETTRRIRAGQLPGINPRVPIIALTAYARMEDHARCLAAGMDAYVAKPIRWRELRAAMESCGLAGGMAAEETPVPLKGVLDAEALGAVRALPGARGPSLLPEMVELYLSDEPERLERIARLIAERNVTDAAHEAHSLGGNAATFGGVEVRRVSLELEQTIRAQSWADADSRLSLLCDACARLRRELVRAGLAS